MCIIARFQLTCQKDSHSSLLETGATRDSHIKINSVTFCPIQDNKVQHGGEMLGCLVIQETPFPSGTSVKVTRCHQRLCSTMPDSRVDTEFMTFEAVRNTKISYGPVRQQVILMA